MQHITIPNSDFSKMTKMEKWREIKDIRNYVKNLRRLFGEFHTPEGIKTNDQIIVNNLLISCCSKINWFNYIVKSLDNMSKELANTIDQTLGGGGRDKGHYSYSLGESDLHRYLLIRS